MEKVLLNKTVLITGATGGIGKETAKALALKGAEVIIVGRNKEKTINTVEEIKKYSDNQKIDYLIADLSSQEEIRKISEEFLKSGRPLHILVNNVGQYFPKFVESVDGIEMTFALNHLSYFLLTNLLIERIKESGKGRIVNVSSIAHKFFNIDFNDLECRKNYIGFIAYCKSKLANILFTRELAKRLRNTGITVNALHPGVVATSFGKMSWWYNILFNTIGRPFQISPEKGARTSIYLCTSPDVENITGEYFVKCKVAPISKFAKNDQAAQKLWEISEKMTNLS